MLGIIFETILIIIVAIFTLYACWYLFVATKFKSEEGLEGEELIKKMKSEQKLYMICSFILIFLISLTGHGIERATLKDWFLVILNCSILPVIFFMLFNIKINYWKKRIKKEDNDVRIFE